MDGMNMRSLPRTIQEQLSIPKDVELIEKHENDCKTSLPLPLICTMEKEVLQILINTYRDYRSQLGVNHRHTREAAERMEIMKQQTAAKIIT
ncbi:hypothetical protein FKM82_017698 [Ascaphus truei]|uniref:cation channel sperm-associated auxiliary subunit zeta n=1 Tax=Ascaphus truei TaxID=8439 RepID=UPI003F5A005E